MGISKIFTSENILALLAIIITSMVIGSIMNCNQSWYESLTKPKKTPAPYVFGVVWTVLYFLLWVSYILNQQDTSLKVLFYLILIIQIVWAYVMYKQQNTMGAVIALIALNIVNIIYFIRYLQINTAYSFVVVPYLIWVLFATYLAYQFQTLNPTK